MEVLQVAVGASAGMLFGGVLAVGAVYLIFRIAGIVR